MAKKSKNLNDDASHLKSDKSQSFQEVSFDVLENAVERKNRKKGYKSKDFRGRAIISSDEVLPEKKSLFKRNKNKEKKDSKVAKLAVAVIISIAILATLTGSLSYLNSIGFFDKPKQSFELKQAIFEISACDEYIVQLNSFLENPINENTISNSGISKDEYEIVKENLQDLDDRISEIATDLDVASEEYVYVGNAKQTIESRIMMIDTGLRIFEEAQKSVAVINKTDVFWDDIVKADACLKESDNLIESSDIENYQIAKKKSEEAIKILEEAKQEIPKLNSMTNAFDFNTYNLYIDTRIESAKLSVEACQALIDQDLNRIASTNIAYIEKSNQASELAKKISSTPAQVIRTNYDINIRPIIDEFKAARNNAADNDYVLRNYLYS